MTTGRYGLSPQHQKAGGIGRAVLNGTGHGLQVMQLRCQRSRDGRNPRLPNSAPCRLSIAGNSLPRDVGEMTIQPLTALTERLFMTQHQLNGVQVNLLAREQVMHHG